MNVPPTCEFKEGVDPECGNVAGWVVINKSTGKIRYICQICLKMAIVPGDSYSVFPSKDYSKPKRSFDREYLGEPFVPDGTRCLRCGGEMVPAVVRDRVPDMVPGSTAFKTRDLKPRDILVCKECGGKERRD